MRGSSSGSSSSSRFSRSHSSGSVSSGGMSSGLSSGQVEIQQQQAQQRVSELVRAALKEEERDSERLDMIPVVAVQFGSPDDALTVHTDRILSQLLEELTKQLDLPAERVEPLVEALLRALDDALPWPIRKPLSNKMYDEFERLHAHMKLMVAQALPLPPTTGVPPPTPLTAQQADALVLGVLDVALDELNLYALECAVMALMAASLVDGDEMPADDSLEAVDRSIAEAEAELRRLRQRREVLAAEGSD